MPKKIFNPRCSGIAWIAVLMTFAARLPELGAQPDDEAVFRGRERVTAIDLLIEFETTVSHQLRSGRLLPKNLLPEEIEVLYDGRPQAVVGIEEIEALDSAGGEWEIVVYFDAVLSTHRGLRWAATTLADRIDRLTARGSVELVWADPLPRTLAAATRDRDLLHLQLAEIAQLGQGRDQLVTLRRQFLEALRDAGAPEADADMTPRELARWVTAEETRLIRRQQDALLTWLTRGEPDRETSGGPSARKLLILVSDGFDLDPGAFYFGAAATAAGGEPAEPHAGSAFRSVLRADTENLARSLSAYGWVVLHLAMPPPPAPPGGIRIGKWLFTPARPQAMIPDPRFRPHSPADRHTERNDLDAIWIFLGGIGGKRQDQRQPDRAQAYLELGLAHTERGDLAAAEDAFRKAFYHFADDPETATQQAEALIGLGSVLEQQGRQEARRIFELAHRRSPDLFAEKLGASAALRDPAAAMALTAEATAGRVVGDAEKIEDALATLDLRVRITYQVSGPTDGELHPVEVRCHRKGYRWRVPGWARSATPETVSAARVRRLLANPGAAVAEDGSFGLEADLRTVADPPGHLALELAVVPVEPWPEVGDETLRISWAFGGRGLPESHVEHRRVERHRPPGEPWRSSLRLAWPRGVDGDEIEWLAVVVEDVDSGRWGAGLIDLYGLD